MTVGDYSMAAVAIAAMLGVPAAARAQAAQEEDADVEDTVIVTATRSGALVRDQPIRVEVVPQEEIEENLTIQPGNLSTLLEELAGVRFESVAPGLGGARLQMRGLPGRHTMVLEDGLPLLGVEGDAFGLLQTPPLDLARVEVIKGVASALYGSSALGGVLNLASRPPGSEPGILLNRTSHAGTDLVGFLATPASHDWGFTLLGGVHDQATEDPDHDGWAELPGYRRYVARPRLYWKNEGGDSFFATLGFMDEDRDGGTVDGQALPGGAMFPEGLQTRRIDGGVTAKWSLDGGRQLGAQVSLVQADRDRTFGNAHVRDVQTTGLAEATLAGKQDGHAWVLGAALTYDELSTDDAPGVSYSYTTPALFVQDEFSVSPAIALVGSARVDAHSDYGTFFSPRISALFRRGDDWSLRASIGTGFAAPTPLMDEVEASSLASLNPLHDLHAERAQSASLDGRWAEGAWEINASVFGSRISDALEVESMAPDRLELVNADGPRRALGGELLVGYTSGAWHVLANYTHLDVTEAAPAGGRRDVELIPHDSAELAGILEDEKRGRVGIELGYTGRQALTDDPFRTVSEPYFEVNALAEIRWGEVSIFVNAINLTDVRQSDYDPLLRPVPGPGGVRVTNLWAPAVGRSFNLGFRWEM